MAAASITGAPNEKVTSLTFYRNKDNYRWFGAEWKVPSNLTKDSNARRATGLEVWVRLNFGSKPTAKYTYGTGTTKCQINLGQGGSTGVTISGKRYKRESFWPLTETKLPSITAYVRATNARGAGTWASVTGTFTTPAKPQVGELERDESTGALTSSIESDMVASGSAERYDTRCQFSVWDSREKATTVLQDWTFQGEEYEFSYDPPSQQALGYDDYLRCKLRACARGFAGDSSWVERTHVLAWPALGTIREVSCSSTRAGGKVTAFVEFSSQEFHPVDGVALEALVSTAITDPEEAMLASGWEATGARDDGTCSALTAGVTDVAPAAGRVTWLRLKTWHDDEATFYRYSEPVRVVELERPAATAADDSVAILSCEPGTDGASAVLVLAWDADGTDDADGTELSWSTDEHAWRSTTGPSTFDVTWDDGPATSGATTWASSAEVHVAGLDEGTVYYVRARRYKDTDDGRTYGPYGEWGVVMPASAPTAVSLSVPGYVATGSSVALAWTVGSESPQASWLVVRDSDSLVVATGFDAAGSCTLPAERVARLVGTDGSLTLHVEVSTGGEYVRSASATIRVADAPTLAVSVDEVTEQPAVVSLACSSPQATVALVVTADGADGSWPDGPRTQCEGDTVWSAVVTPEWEAEGGEHVAEVAMPAPLDLWDGAGYTLVAVATDVETGMASAEAVVGVGVSYAHRPVGVGDVTVTPAYFIDASGRRSLSAAITVEGAEGAEPTDVYDVYRMTPDGPRLVARGVPAGTTVTDPYAPFGSAELAYRVAVRTADGVCEWEDFPYALACDEVRVDFGGDYVMLPYDVTVSEAWEKDFQARTHLGGTTEGFWNEGATHRQSLSADLSRHHDGAKGAALRRLASYAGPCFVRTPSGCAFEADVQVRGLDESYGSVAVDVALEATEVSPTGAYDAVTPTEAGPVGGEEE